MNWYYILTAAFALVNLVLFLFSFREKKLNYYMLLLMAVMALSNAGTLAVSMSRTLEEAILAKKIYYLGGCFLPAVMLLVITFMGNIRVKTRVKNLLFSYSILVYAMVLTIGYNDIYYKDCRIETIHGVTTIVPTYGVGHTFFYILLYGYMAAGVAILIYSLVRKNGVSHKNLWILLAMEIMTIAIFLLGRAIAPHLEPTPLVYVLNGWIFLYLSHRVTLYSVEDGIVSSLEKSAKDGYILFDNHMNYLGSSMLAKKILPALEECQVDIPLSRYDNLAFIDIWLNQYRDDIDSPDAILPIDAGERHYECNIDRMWYAESAVGYVVEIQDCTERFNYLKLLSTYNTELEQEVQKKTEHISTIQQYVVLGMANMVENRDNNTGGHIKRTSGVIRIFVDTIKKNKLMNLSDAFCQDLIKAAPMHDLGKIAIDDMILRKPGALTDEEFAIMKIHAAKSAELVKGILHEVEEEHFVEIAVNVARHHHEKWNGKGYPDALAGEEIPLEARIMAIADVYDALVSKRCYKEPMSFERANEVMLESMGNHFDPGLKEMYVLSRERLEDYYGRE